ncbi:hypothetical protein V1286_001746 [Bradyrhizobium algeriense]|uniref:Uncharacterized protein n=1 Tax=Bradyrhizobium algeriense TaxID=634784 RepID=A0ABU8B6Q2_9BRAD
MVATGEVAAVHGARSSRALRGGVLRRKPEVPGRRADHAFFVAAPPVVVLLFISSPAVAFKAGPSARELHTLLHPS